MRKLRFYWLLTVATFTRLNRRLRTIRWRKRYLGLGFLAALGVGLLLQILIHSLTSNSLSEGIIGDYSVQNLPPTVTNLLSEPLVSLDDHDLPQPALAKSWQVNNDATVYTFTLRDNLNWNDGTKLVSSDLSFDIPNAAVSYPDSKTIVFTFNEPFSPLPSLLTQPVMKDSGLVGVGQYQVVRTDIDSDGTTITRLILKPKNSQLPDITIRFYQDEKTAKTGFWLGEIQALLGVTDTSDVPLSSHILLKKVPNYSRIVTLFYNTKDPILADKNLRKALAFAVPQVSGEEYAKTSIPANSWAFNDQVRDYLQHPDQAGPFLDKVKVGKDKPIALTVTPQLAPLADKIVQGWKGIGINAVTRVESGVPQNFQALLITQELGSDPDQYFLWHSTETKTNLSQYNSERVDKDLEDGRKTADIQTRKDRYTDMQKVLAEDEPATFIYFPKFEVVYLKKAETNLNKVLDLQLKLI